MAGMRRPVAVIIGMMGAGKTRVGKEAAQMMQLPFADADNEIEHDAGMKIPEYFERYGEPEFRKLESDVVLDMLEDFDGIFSLGGGAPMTPSIQQGLAEYIADGGKVVDNWQNGSGELVWKNGTNELCWRDASWTPATAAEGCDGALVKAADAPAPAAAPAAAKPAPAPAPVPAASAPPAPRSLPRQIAATLIGSSFAYAGRA